MATLHKFRVSVGTLTADSKVSTHHYIIVLVLVCQLVEGQESLVSLLLHLQCALHGLHTCSNTNIVLGITEMDGPLGQSSVLVRGTTNRVGSCV